MSERIINATDFKAKCLGLLEEVRESGAEVTITKHGKPVAKLVPIPGTRKSLRGLWKGGRVKGDIVNVDWTDSWMSAILSEPGKSRTAK